MRALVPVILLALAGCAGTAQDRSRDLPAPLGAGLDGDATCPCAPLAFYLEAPLPPASYLLVATSWNGTDTRGIAPHLALPNGTLAPAERGFDAYRIVVWGAPAGAYTLLRDGVGAHHLSVSIQVHGAKPTSGPLLPNLVTLLPVNVEVAGCDPYEQAEQGAARCLRLSNGVGNVGTGPLEVHLDFPESASALAGEGRFVQRVYQADGTYEDHDVGAAQLHLVHGHWHYAGLATFSLYRYDLATGLRAGAAASHMKAGFCFLDWGKMREADAPDPERGTHAEQNCLIPGLDGWSMGISPGWYDFYRSGLTDQYVEISDVPDGTYELVSVADGGRTLQESDESDNAASVVLELHGGQASVLEERAFHRPAEG